MKKRWLSILMGAVLGAVIGYGCWKFPALEEVHKNLLSVNGSMTSGFIVGAVLSTILTSRKQIEN